MENYTHTFTHDDMSKLLSSSYRGQDRNVIAEFSNNDRGYTSIKLTETVSLDGVTKTASRVLKKENFERIIRRIYKWAGQQVTSIVNYGEAGTCVMDCGLKTLVSPEQENRVVVRTQEIQKVNVRR